MGYTHHPRSSRNPDPVDKFRKDLVEAYPSNGLSLFDDIGT
jgi:hypothetical protein